MVPAPALIGCQDINTACGAELSRAEPHLVRGDCCPVGRQALLAGVTEAPAMVHARREQVCHLAWPFEKHWPEVTVLGVLHARLMTRGGN